MAMRKLGRQSNILILNCVPVSQWIALIYTVFRQLIYVTFLMDLYSLVWQKWSGVTTNTDACGKSSESCCKQCRISDGGKLMASSIINNHVAPPLCEIRALENLRPRPHISVHLKTQLFLCRLAFRLHVSGENGDQKCNFLRTHSRVEIFENAVFVFSYGRWKRNFSKTMTSQHWIQPTPRKRRAKSVLLLFHCYLGLFQA